MIAGNQTSRPPVNDPHFQREIANCGVGVEQVPERLCIANQSFPVVRTTMETMRRMGYRPVLSR
jgi:hypothetical protein